MRLFESKYPVILLNGPRRCGKTFLVTYLITCTNVLDNIKNIYICSPTIMNQTEYLDTIVKRLDDKHIEIIYSNFEEYDFTTVPPDSILLLDDIGRLQNKTFLRVLIANRHRRVKIIFLAQYLTHMLREARFNLDYVFIFKGNNLENRNLLYKEFGGNIMSKEKYENLYMNLKRYEFLVFAFDQDENFVKCLLKK